ncbi:porin family protein [Pontibacter chinhatensis]|uniref:Outer membrane protein beta-barrel domain-containing protein n=1 Tax=Pontibacter chinhatensis TaxID=1436961 RepID=A0A1I2ZFV1_9BACT|nr:hypothetical protein [Pontibacter chinhatensis]SFH36505.1 hypothetical protein SAMN05421739_11354 [Pontibacter chinhatensis]
MSDEELDDLFRRSAEGYEPPFDPEAWKAMDRRLDGKAGAGATLRRWLPVLLLGLLLGVVTVWQLTENAAPTVAPEPGTASKEKALITPPTELPGRGDAGASITSPESRLPASSRPLTPAAPASPQRSVSAAPGPAATKATLAEPLKSTTPVIAAQGPSIKKYSFGNSVAPLAAKYKPAATAPDSTTQPTEAEPDEPYQEKVFLRNITLALVVAPDFTTVRFKNAEAVSMNAGLLVSLPLTKRLSLVTGALNATKRYNTNAREYEPYTGFWDGHHIPDAIVAKCQVLDIPLNLQYVVLARSKHAVSVQAGLSSYLMLNEKYTYRYGGPRPYIRDLEVRNENRHWFGVQNLSVGYTHQLSPAFSFGAEPFAKIPLADIGAGRVKLTSAGILFKAGYTLR